MHRRVCGSDSDAVGCTAGASVDDLCLQLIAVYCLGQVRLILRQRYLVHLILPSSAYFLPALFVKRWFTRFTLLQKCVRLCYLGS